MGSENGTGAAAMAGEADIAQSEPAFYKDGAKSDAAQAKTGSGPIANDSHANGANGDVGSGWMNASSPEKKESGWISADVAPVALPPTIASQPWPATRQRTLYLIRIPRSVDEKLRSEIRLAEAKLEQAINKRDSQKAALQAKKNIKIDLLEKLKPIRDKERACREAILGKRIELEPFSAALNKFRSAQNRGQDLCSSEEELNDKIAEMQFRIQHESIPLKEEKQLLREIKQLESTRSQVSANSLLQAELMENLGPKEEIQDQAKFLRQDLDTIRKEHRQARIEYDAMDKEINKLNEAIEELRQQFEKANAAQQDAYAAVRELKREENLKNEPFYKNKRDVQVVRELAAQKKAKEVEEFCAKQVEDFMALWSNDSKFRGEYIKSNERSTVRRLETLDGRSLGPNEKAPVLSDDALPSKSHDAKPLADIPTSGALKVGKLSGVELTNGGLVEETKQEKPSALLSRDGAGDAVVYGADTKLRQNDASEDVSASLEAKAAVQKERLRQEQIAKAKEAEERKKKRSEQLESRALARAKKDADRKEKEREKKAQKKATAAASASRADATLEPTGGSELQDQKQPADAEPLIASSEDATNSTTNLSSKDRKGSANRRKLSAREMKPAKPKLGKKASKKATLPAPLWAIASISALVLFVVLILFLKL